MDRHRPAHEIRPKFAFDPKGGPDGQGAMLIEADGREGLDGGWVRTLAVKGGGCYRFEALRKVENVASPRRSAVVKITWLDAAGKRVPCDEPVVTGYLRGSRPTAEPEHPTDKGPDARGWTEVSDTYRAPSKATRAVVELRLLWAPGGKIAWAGVSLKEVAPPAGRKVRLAAVHFRPKGGKTPMDNCRMFAPLIAEAARQKADLVVLGEVVLTIVGNGMKVEQAAEPIPGPSTEYFGQLAKKHNLYIVAGLNERDGHLIYNTAVLLGPDGKLVGKYRKVCLPRDEIAGGVAPGHDYPVFETRFGKVWHDGLLRRLLPRGGAGIGQPRRGGDRLAGLGLQPALAQARAWRITSTSSAAPTRTSRATGCSRRCSTTRAARSPWPRSGARWPWPRWTWTSGPTGSAWATSRPRCRAIGRSGESRNRDWGLGNRHWKLRPAVFLQSLVPGPQSFRHLYCHDVSLGTSGGPGCGNTVLKNCL